MTGLKRSRNPFLRGNRPRRYFGELISIMRMKSMTSDKRKYNPDWRIGKVAV